MFDPMKLGINYGNKDLLKTAYPFLFLPSLPPSTASDYSSYSPAHCSPSSDSFITNLDS